MRLKRLFGIALCAVMLLTGVFLSLDVFADDEPFTLDLRANPDESGTFEAEIEGLLQPGAKFEVKKGVHVTIKAIPAEGYAFESWEFANPPEGVTDESLLKPELTFVMPGDHVGVVANFKEEAEKYTVTLEANDHGMGNFGFMSFLPGETVSVEALPYEGYRFKRWIDPTSAMKDVELPKDWEKQSGFSFPMPDRDVVLEPEFEPITYYMTVKTVGQGEAYIAGKQKNASGKYEFHVGETIFISAIHGKDYAFVNWSATDSAELTEYEEAETTVVCPANNFTLTANFASSVRKLTIETTEGGSVTPQPGTTNVGVGNIVSLIATPNEGYAFSHWECSTDNGKFESAKDSDTSFTMPDEACTIKAVFIKGGYRLTLSASAGGEAKGEEGVYEMGEKLTIEASSFKGYVFSHWKCDVNGVVKDTKKLKTKVEIPGEDVTVTAVFVLQATLEPEETLPPEEKNINFTWVILVVVFIFSAIAIGLVVLREQLNLSYRYLIGKWYDGFVAGLKKLKEKIKKGKNKKE